jgi:hypothetical protein
LPRQSAGCALFANRRRAISAAAAAPNRIIIGGAGTGDGLPLLVPGCPPFEDHPLEDEPQPLDDEPQPLDDEP